MEMTDQLNQKAEVKVALLLDLDGTLIQRYGEGEGFAPRPPGELGADTEAGDAAGDL
jgi:hypothetical protein